MNKNEKYGKHILGSKAAPKFVSRGKSLRVNYSGGIYTSIDGIVEDGCAVEIGGRLS